MAAAKVNITKKFNSKVSVNVKKEKFKHLIKPMNVCLVNLTKEQIEQHTGTYTHNTDIKIKSDSNEINRNFEIKLRISGSELTIEHYAKVKPNQKKEPKLVQCKVKSLTQLIEESWRKAKSCELTTEFKCGDIVTAKMKGYAPWPAKIISFNKNKKRANVFFFGTANSGSVDVKEMVPFENAFEVMRLLLIRNQTDYSKSVFEVEIVCGIPPEYSLINKQNEIA